MDALTAPRAFRKTESMSQNKMRGLGIEESDSRNNVEAVPHEAAKPRGKSLNARENADRTAKASTRFYFHRRNEIRSNYSGHFET